MLPSPLPGYTLPGRVPGIQYPCQSLIVCQMPYMIAREASAWRPLLRRPLVRLHGVSISSSALVSLLPGGMRTVGCVHRYCHVVHPWRGIGRCHLLWCEASCRLGVPWLETLLGIVVAKALEVRCVLRNRVDQLHRFDDSYEASLHGAIGSRYWGCEYFIQ
jgi:hypothetical protein